MLRRVYFPDLLDSDAVMLGIRIFIQAVMADQLLPQVPSTALCKQGVTGMEFHAGHIGIFLAAVHTNAHFTRGDAFYRTILVEQYFCCGKSRIYLNAQGFRLLGQPAAYIAHGDNVVAFVVGWFGYQEVG